MNTKCMRCNNNERVDIHDASYCNICYMHLLHQIEDNSIEKRIKNLEDEVSKLKKKEESSKPIVDKTITILDDIVSKLRNQPSKYNEKGGRIHHCSVDLDSYVKIEGSMGVWLLTYRDKGSFYVDYCPWCGVKLNE